MTIPTSIDTAAPVVAHHEIDIHASLDAVWERHIDVTGWTSWNPDMTSARLEGPLAPGVSFDWESYGFPVRSNVYDLQPHHRVLWGGTAGGITGVHEWLLTATADGVHVETNESFAGVPDEADRAGMQSLLDSSLVAWLSQLKTASESGSAAREDLPDDPE